MCYVSILGIRVNQVSKLQALGKVLTFLESNRQHTIFTPNPEMIVDAQKDHYFKEVLNSGDLNICDGKGIQLVVEGKIERIPGTDFMLDICRLAEQKKYSVYFLGSGSQEVLSKLIKSIQILYPTLNIAGFHPGFDLEVTNCRLNIDLAKNDELIKDISSTQPKILFVAFGHGKQEKWIHENLIRLPSIKIAMGVGGAFDYISGSKKRAPTWMRNAGLEWLYRTIQEPQRCRRIWKATVKFLWLYFVRSKAKNRNV